jgi:hypothetical protein
MTIIWVITQLPNTEQSSKGKGKTHKSTNRQNQSTTIFKVILVCDSRAQSGKDITILKQFFGDQVKYQGRHDNIH